MASSTNLSFRSSLVLEYAVAAVTLHLAPQPSIHQPPLSDSAFQVIRMCPLSQLMHECSHKSSFSFTRHDSCISFTVTDVSVLAASRTVVLFKKIYRKHDITFSLGSNFAEDTGLKVLRDNVSHRLRYTE